MMYKLFNRCKGTVSFFWQKSLFVMIFLDVQSREWITGTQCLSYLLFTADALYQVFYSFFLFLNQLVVLCFFSICKAVFHFIFYVFSTLTV